MIRADDFRTFLLNHGAYEVFRANLDKQKNIAFEKLMLHAEHFDCFNGLIDSSLNWAMTPQGHNYWSDLSKTWNVECITRAKVNSDYKSIW